MKSTKSAPSVAPAVTPKDNPLDLNKYGKLPARGQFFVLSRNFTPPEIKGIFVELKAKLSNQALPPGQGDWAGRFPYAGSSPGGAQWKAVVSAFAVAFDHVPSFLDSPEPVEKRCGYVVLIEIELLSSPQNPFYLFVQRLHLDNPCAGLDQASSLPTCHELELEMFLEPFTKGTSRFESISMRPMSMSHSDVRRKVIEAYDVQTAMSSLGLNRVVAGSLRVVQPAGAAASRRFSLSPRLRKLQQTGEKLSLSALTEWAAGIAVELDGAKNLSSAFLRSFAAPVPSLKGKAAQSVLIDVPILQKLVEDSGYRIVDTSRRAKTQPRPIDDFKSLIESMDDVVSLSEQSPSSGKFVGTFPGSSGASVAIKVMNRTCTLTLGNCQWGVQETPSVSNPSPPTIPLDRFLNEKKAFRVLLEHGTIMFCAEGAFTDADIRHSATLLLNIIRPFTNDLGVVVTEKGTPTANAPAFDPTSSFGVIESVISNSHAWLLCDDSKKEWCDFLSMSEANPTTPPEVRWYHAKVNRVKDSKSKQDLPMNVTRSSASASGLQEVVGQAVKNLGRIRMNSTHGDVKKHRKGWECLYTWPDEPTIQSAMPCLRRTPGGPGSTSPSAIDAFLKTYDAATANPHATFEVALVVPNYKKSALESSFGKLGTAKGTQTTAQMFWLLSGFMHSCIEIGVRPVIYCR